MRIYIDGLFYKKAGVGRYYESLLGEMAKRGTNIITTIPEGLKSQFEREFDGISNIQPIFVDFDKFSLKGALKTSKILGQIERDTDLFFFPHVNLPFYVPRRTVVTIHDLRPLTEFWDRNTLKRFAFKIYLERAVNRSEALVCVSEYTREQLAKIYPSSREKGVVIYNFVSDKFSERVETERRIKEPYILFVGTRKRHKNLHRLVQAFCTMKDKIPHNLVIAGGKENDKDDVDSLIKKLKLEKRVVELISPDDETLTSLYRYADLFVFPSLFEGFGLPPLEAVSSGCTVVMSDIPVLREIFDEAGIYFNPYDVQEIADRILRVLCSTDIKRAYGEEQKKRLKLFDKGSIVAQYTDLFDKLRKRANDKSSSPW